MQSLQALHLTGNRYRGNLDLFSLKNLQNLSISNNRFYGTLPKLAMNNMSFQYFDISDNLFTGCLDVDVNPIGNNSVFHADVNRLSGYINIESINKFSDVDVLHGNIMSCDTIPDRDSEFETYICETWIVDYSVYSWIVVCGGFLLIFICIRYMWRNVSVLEPIVKKWKLIYGANLSVVDSKASNMSKLLSSLQQITTLLVLLIPPYALLMVSLYMIFRSSKTSSTHYNQYIFIISGIFLRGVDPAVCLLVLFVVLVAMLTKCLSKMFSYSGLTDCPTVQVPSPKETCYSVVLHITKICALLAFSFVVFLINVLYVLNISNLNDDESIATLSAIFVFDYVYKVFGLPWLLRTLYNHKDGRAALVAYTLISTLFDIVAPCLATLIADPRCFGSLIFRERNITVEYSVLNRCLTFLGDECADSIAFTNTYSFAPPFIYSGQCRNALFSNFMPNIIIGSIFDTCLFPISYLLFNWYSTDITIGKQLNATWFQRTVQDYVNIFIMGEVSYWLVAIFEDFALLSIYGIISPICAVVIATGIIAKTYILRVGIVRCHSLQGPDMPMNEEHIEVLCANAMKNTDFLMWPSFIIASVFFTFYLWEMTGDVDEPDEYSAWTIFAVTIAMLLGIKLVQVVELRIRERRPTKDSILIDDFKILTKSGLLMRPSMRSSATTIVSNPMIAGAGAGGGSTKG